jgi:serine/threonine-protein kinase
VPSLIGRLVGGRWRVVSLLGAGGMSSVYAAVHRNGLRVAIKVLHPELAPDARARERFLREGHIANGIEHPGIVATLDDGVTEDGLPFLVLEMLVGATLEQHCRSQGGTLPEGEVLVIADAVLDVLAATHARGIVHRDVKSSNVFLTTDGSIKLLDFGVARLRELRGTALDTKKGAILGTPGFMAPEQARGRWDEVDARTDLWALGATMFRLLTGRLVHESPGTANEAMIAAAMSPAPKLTSVNPSLTASAPIIDGALLLDPRERWSSATAMRVALAVARAGLPACELPRSAPPGSPAMLETVDETALPATASERPTPPAEAPRPRRLGLRRLGGPAAAAVALTAVIAWRSIAARPHRGDAAEVSRSGAPATHPPMSMPVAARPEPRAPAAARTDAPAAPVPPVRRRRHQPARLTAAETAPAPYLPMADLPPEEIPPPSPNTVPTRLEDVLDERR